MTGPAAAADPGPCPEPDPAASVEPPRRALVADDEPHMLALLTRVLECDGFHVVTATDGQAALEVVARGGVDVVVCDLRMPRLDGLGVVRALGAIPGGPPVVVVSASLEPDDAGALRAAGARDVLRKPFEPAALRSAVRRALAPAKILPGGPPGPPGLEARP